jgi:hypothetical protein
VGATEPLGHETVLEVGEAGRLLVVALGEKHVPEAEGPRLGLEVLDDGRVAFPSRIALTRLGLDDGVCSARVLVVW